MISYEPLWDTMRKQGVTTYTLIKYHDIPVSTIHSLKHNKNITMLTLEKLCTALNCTPDSIVEFKKEL